MPGKRPGNSKKKVAAANQADQMKNALIIIAVLFGSLGLLSLLPGGSAPTKPGQAPVEEAEDEGPSDVVVGTAGNFDSLVSNGVALVKFYAPWCGHCKKMAPDYAAAATELLGKATLVKVDATKEKELGERFKVEGFPTIKAFIDGDVQDYDGGRTAKDFVSWVSRMTGPAVRDVTDAAALTALRETERVAVVGFFASKDAAEAQAFQELAEENRMAAVYAAAYSAGAAKAEGVAAPGVVVYKQFDEGKAVMPEFDVDEILTFAKAASFPVLGEMGPDNYADYTGRGLPIAWLFLGEDAADGAAKAAAEKACKPAMGKLSCVHLSGKKYGQMAERVGLTGKKFPCFAIADGSVNYPLDEATAIEGDALVQYVADFVAGALTPTVKSEAIPEEHTVDGLTTLVGDSIKDLAFDEEKNVLIKFYAPWCGHCKKMAPDYAKVAAHYADDADVMIADFEATANDAPKEFKVEGFPTLYFKKKGSTTHEVCSAGRDFDGIKDYIEANRA